MGNDITCKSGIVINSLGVTSCQTESTAIHDPLHAEDPCWFTWTDADQTNGKILGVCVQESKM